MTETSPTVAIIEVVHCGLVGVTALVDGQRRVFPDLDAVFRTAVHLLDEKTQPHTRPHLPLRPLLPGLAP